MLLMLLLLCPAFSQKVYTGMSTYAILGEMKPKSELIDVSYCFWGFGFASSSCAHVSEHWYDTNPGMASVPMHWKSKFSTQDEYCVECCDNSRLDAESDESWRLKCETSQASNFVLGSSELRLRQYQSGAPFQFRFATRETIDQPITSTGCNDNDGDIVCCTVEYSGPRSSYARANETRNHLYGYELTIHVKERNSGFKYWRSVTNCSARALEVDYTQKDEWDEHFMEVIRLVTSHGQLGTSPCASLVIPCIMMVVASLRKYII